MARLRALLAEFPEIDEETLLYRGTGLYTPHNGSFDHMNWTAMQVVEWVSFFCLDYNVLSTLLHLNFDGECLDAFPFHNPLVWETIGIHHDVGCAIALNYLVLRDHANYLEANGLLEPNAVD
ncbi:hypothetical protein GCK72_026134 [Caenorhabditis remanei]|uniref:Uncharacterized protein n=1 Tax=Caenorhabditis remanei TaxID=31234 RepID=A0A6A5G408_CAERE|nr:hypothetical protein GCK72_026134 [Caenorhabditis remanei]KAF1749666.1 hypothetical protein GCK72_026134 [Caenorhabditis remanei]